MNDHVIITSPQEADTLAQSLRNNPSLGRRVRSLEFRYHESVCADRSATLILPLTPELESLSISSGCSADDYRLESVGDMTEESFQFFSLFANKADDGAIELKDFLPSLQSCKFNYVSQPWDPKDKLPFLIRPGLKSLTLQGIAHSVDNADMWADYQTSKPNGSPPSNLNSLEIIGQVEYSGLVDILSFQRALKRLTFTYLYYDKAMESIAPNRRDGYLYWRAVDRIRDHLEVLNIVGVETLQNAPNKPTFNAFPRLQTLRTTAAFLGDRQKVDATAWRDVVPAQVVNFSLTTASGNRPFNPS